MVPTNGPLVLMSPLGIQINLGKSLLVLKSPILVDILSFMWWWSRLPVPSQAKDTCKGGAVEIYQGITTQGLHVKWGLEWGSVEIY